MAIKVGSNPTTTLTSNSYVYSYAANNVTQASGWTGTLFIWTTDPTDTVPSCVSGLNLVAVSSLGLDKGTSSNFGFGSPVPLPANYYTVRSGTAPSSGPGIITIQQGTVCQAHPQSDHPWLRLRLELQRGCNRKCLDAERYYFAALDHFFPGRESDYKHRHQDQYGQEPTEQLLAGCSGECANRVVPLALHRPAERLWFVHWDGSTFD